MRAQAMGSGSSPLHPGYHEVEVPSLIGGIKAAQATAGQSWVSPMEIQDILRQP